MAETGKDIMDLEEAGMFLDTSMESLLNPVPVNNTSGCYERCSTSNLSTPLFAPIFSNHQTQRNQVRPQLNFNYPHPIQPNQSRVYGNLPVQHWTPSSTCPDTPVVNSVPGSAPGLNGGGGSSAINFVRPDVAVILSEEGATGGEGHQVPALRPGGSQSLNFIGDEAVACVQGVPDNGANYLCVQGVPDNGANYLCFPDPADDEDISILNILDFDPPASLSSALPQPPLSNAVPQPSLANAVPQPSLVNAVPQPPLANAVPQPPPLANDVPQPPPLVNAVPQPPSPITGKDLKRNRTKKEIDQVTEVEREEDNRSAEETSDTRREEAKKRRLHLQPPCNDPREEKRRKDAVRAWRVRENKKKETEDLKAELSKVKAELSKVNAENEVLGAQNSSYRQRETFLLQFLRTHNISTSPFFQLSEARQDE